MNSPLKVLVPTPDALLNEWKVCDKWPEHLGGWCKRCQIQSSTVYCHKCQRKTGPQEIFCEDCIRQPRTLHLVVEWIRRGKFKNDWIKGLTKPLQQIFRDTCSQFAGLRFSGDNERWIKQRLNPLDGGKGFREWLLLGWYIRQDDHLQGLKNKSFRSLVMNLAEAKKKDSSQETLEEIIQKLLELTYVPRMIIESTPDIRKHLDLSRKEDSTALRSLRQHLGKSVDPRASTDQEQIFFSQFGMDKLTRDPSKQLIWTWLFTPLVFDILPYAKQRKEDRFKNDKYIDDPFIPDDVFIKASELVHLRYPDLWEGQWPRVRDRCLAHIKNFGPHSFS